MGLRLPGNVDGLDALWPHLTGCHDLVTEIDPARWAVDALSHPRRSEPGRSITFAAGVLDDVAGFDAAFFGIAPREAELLDPQQRLLLELAWEAFEDAGIRPSSFAGSDCAVFVGISGLDYGMRVLDDLSSMSAHTMTGNTMSVAANRLSWTFDLHGPSMAVDTACSSSLVALHQACELLRQGQAPAALVGGVNLLLHPYPFVGFTKASMLSAGGRCRAFGAGGDGYVRGEGGGVLLLKPLAAALRDGDRIRGVIRATGVNADGARKTGLTIPSGEAQAELMRSVLARSGLRPQDIGYVEAHGTGTRIGDPIEARAVGTVYGAGSGAERAEPLPIGSVKSNLGHLEPASGMAGLAKALTVLEHGVAPPSLHAETLNPDIDFDALHLRVAREPVALPPDSCRVAVNSFGFGGVNAHVILEPAPEAGAPSVSRAEAPAAFQAAPAAAVRAPLVISAADDAALRQLAARYADALASAEDAAASARLAQAAWERRDWLAERIAITDGTTPEAVAALQAFAAGAEPSGVIRERALRGAATGPAPVALVYSGNGAQWTGMGRALLAASPRFATRLGEVANLVRAYGGPDILAALASDDPATLQDTAVAQPALFAVQVAATELLRAEGLCADAAMGHSVGEIAAAWAVGALDLAQAARVIVARSRAQARTRGTGRMAAVGLSAEAMQRRLDELAAASAPATGSTLTPALSRGSGRGGDLRTAPQPPLPRAGEGGGEGRATAAPFARRITVAADNSPRNCTVSGPADALAELRAALGESVFFRELDLDYAFHSPAMDPIHAALLDDLAGLDPGAARPLLCCDGAPGRFFSTVHGAELSADALGAAYWWHNVRDPVRFGPAVAAMWQAGYCVFVEVGPNAILQRYITETLEGLRADGRALAHAPRRADTLANIRETVLRAALLGASVDARAPFPTPLRGPVALPRYPWQHQPHWYAGTPESYRLIQRASVHPLLGCRLKEMPAAWEAQLDPIKSPWLADHRVGGAVVLPGAAYVEMALAAAREWFGSRNDEPPSATSSSAFVVDELDILAPVVFDGEHARSLRVLLDPDDLRLRIESRQRLSDDPWTLHARCKLAAPPAAALQMACARDALPVPGPRPARIDGAQLYAAATALGLDYGPEFRRLQEIAVDGPALQATITRPPTPAPTLAAAPRPQEAFLLHPALLDQCFQAIIAWFHDAQDPSAGSMSYLPVGIGRLVLYGTGDAASLVGRLRRRGPRSVLADFELRDAAGRLLTVATGCRLRAAALRQAAPPPAVWEQAARLAPLESAPQPALPATATLARAIEQSWADDPEGARRRYAEEAAPLLELLPLAYARDALRSVALSRPAREGRGEGNPGAAPLHPLPRAGESGGEGNSSAAPLPPLPRAGESGGEGNSSAAPLPPLPRAGEGGGEGAGHCSAPLPDTVLARWRTAHPLLRWLLDELQAQGLLRPDGDGWRIDDAELPPSTEIWTSALAACPAAAPDLLRIGRVGLHLDALAAAADAPPIRPDEPATPDPNTPAYAGTRAGLAAAFQALAARWPQGRRLRVLEIGHGDSALAAVCDVLAPAPALDLVLARSAADDLGALRAAYDGHPAITVAALVSEPGNGLALDAAAPLPAHFDVVVLDHVLHRYARPAHALGALLPRLAADAVLLLAERHPDHAATFTEGARADWWHPAAEPGTGFAAGAAAGSASVSTDAAHHPALQGPQGWEALLHHLGWTECQAVSDPAAGGLPIGGFLVLARPAPGIGEPAKPAASRRYAVLTLPGSDEDLADDLAHRLAAADQAVQRIRRMDLLDLLPLPEGPGVGTADVVHWVVFPAPPPAAAVAQACDALRRLLLELAARSPQATVHLVLPGGAPHTAAPSPAAAALWGLARVARNELHPLALRCIDPGASPDALLRECLGAAAPCPGSGAGPDGAETEVAWIDGRRYALRLLPHDAAPPAATTSAAPAAAASPAPSWRLDFPLAGQLRNLRWVGCDRPAPGPGEIEIEARAAGLNFRDVMYAMGLLADEALEQGFAGPTLGLEVAGVVARCGPGVERFRPGDAVLAFAGASFAAHVVVPERAVAPKPAAWTFAEAATVPTVFFTVWYALTEVARLQPGERILIHGAAGGVGIAAIQVAHLLGAEIVASAGSDARRDFARLLGADHVVDSRDPHFDEAVLAATEGEGEGGVDVVLNSLAGEAIARNLRALRPFGRFIELGKRDFYEDTRIGLRPFRNNVSYFGVDADQLMRLRPELATRIFTEVMARFADGSLHPLPHRIFAADRVVDAFRHMQQARQIGKVVVDLQTPPRAVCTPTPPARWRAAADATYLVAGGLGGFGLATAAWLAERGARHLVLLGRRGATAAGNGPEVPAAAAALDALRARGVEVDTPACDIADRDALAAVLAAVRAKGLRRGAPLRGVLHTAMVLDDALLPNLDAARFAAVLAPKLDGAWNLHHLTRADPLDCFVLYSSATTVLGNPGQANYVAANAALEALARLRRAQGLPATAVAWGPIGDVGVLTRNAAARDALHTRLGAAPLAAAAALQRLEGMLAKGESGLAVMDFEWGVLQRSLPSAGQPYFDELRRRLGHAASHASGDDLRARLAALPPDEAVAAIAQILVEEIAAILRLPPERVVPAQSVYDLGMDSLMAVELALALEKCFDLRIPPMWISENPTIGRIAERIHHALLSGPECGAAADATGATGATGGTRGADATAELVRAMAAQHAEGAALQDSADDLAAAVRDAAAHGTRLIP